MKLAFREFPLRESQAFPEQTSVLRPVIPVTLRHPHHLEKQLTLHCIIDSGADHCMFPTSIASALDLYRVDSGPAWTWASADDNVLVAHLHPVILDIGEYHWECPALFSHDLNHAPYGILGLEGFFDHFNVQIDYKTLSIEMTPNI